MSSTLLVQVLDKVSLATSTLVWDSLLILALGEEANSGVRTDVVATGDVLIVGSVGVHLGDNAFRLGLEGLGDLFERGLQVLAVSAPGGRECYDNVVFGVLWGFSQSGEGARERWRGIP